MKARKEMVRMGTKVGAVLGGIAFLAFGILPDFNLIVQLARRSSLDKIV